MYEFKKFMFWTAVSFMGKTFGGCEATSTYLSLYIGRTLHSSYQ